MFAALCWKKRRGIYNTYMKLTGQEIPYSVQEKRRKKYGYYDQELNASMDLENPVYITENDGSANELETDSEGDKNIDRAMALIEPYIQKCQEDEMNLMQGMQQMDMQDLEDLV